MTTDTDLTAAWDVDPEPIEGDIVSPPPLAIVRAVVDVAADGSVDFTVPLSTDEARELTEHIRSAADMLYVLINRAHAGRAWEALGYGTFADYVKAEFDISRSRAYQLINQANVVAAIEAASPDGTNVHISEATARDLRSVIGDVIPEIEDRTRDLPADEAGDVVEEIVEEYRDKARQKREDHDADYDDDDTDSDAGFSNGGGDGIYTPPPPPPIYDEDYDVDPVAVRRTVQAAYDLYSSLSALVSMPNIQSIIDTIPVERRLAINESLPQAAKFLNEFKDMWFVQVWQTEVPGEFGGGGGDS